MQVAVLFWAFWSQVSVCTWNGLCGAPYVHIRGQRQSYVLYATGGHLFPP